MTKRQIATIVHGTYWDGDGKFHPAVAVRGENDLLKGIWYWPNVTKPNDRDATEWADEAIASAKRDNDLERRMMFEWNILDTEC